MIINRHEFEYWDGAPIKDLLREVRKTYPFADYDFDGGGVLYFRTGLYIERKPIVIPTPFIENASDGVSRLERYLK